MSSKFSRLPWGDDFKYHLDIGDDRQHHNADPPEVTRGWVELIAEDEVPIMTIRERETRHETGEELYCWGSAPTHLWDFIEVVRDEYYERDIDSQREIPLFVETNRAHNDGMDFEFCTLSVQDTEGGEYVKMTSDELYSIDSDGELVFNSTRIQTMLEIFRDVYENPSQVKEAYSTQRKQLTTR